jgi:hypothetical protein
MSEEQATCRGCGRVLRGKPYHMGGDAYIPETGERARKNFYGGYVCSPGCDRRSSLELEQSMPGHDHSQRRLGCFAAKSFRDNWEQSA